MTSSRLSRTRREQVTVLLAQLSPPDELGELGERSTTWAPGDNYDALVTPLGLEETARAGLTADRERLRVQLPRLALALPCRLHLRGAEWQAVHIEHWHSYSLLIVEGV